MLDALTLDTVGVLDLDVEGNIKASAQGRLLIAIRDALLFVDVREPSQPVARAAVPFTFDSELTTHDDRVYVGSERTQSYPIDLHNLLTTGSD